VLLRLIAQGVPYSHACAVARVSAQSFNNYRQDHPAFKEMIERAVGRAIERRLRTIEKAANSGDVSAAQWLLIHLHPADFARNRVEICGPNGAPLTGIVAVALPPKDSEAALEVCAVAEPLRLEANGAN
jgi:hypothetical protein